MLFIKKINASCATASGVAPDLDVVATGMAPAAGWRGRFWWDHVSNQFYYHTLIKEKENYTKINSYYFRESYEIKK
jgi:hypothetical protein